MSYPKTIAVDGPAASGKSTLAHRLANELNYLFFDTGVMYRAVTWATLSQQISFQDEQAVTQLAQQIHIDVRPASVADDRSNDILVDEQDVTWQIRSSEVDANVSVVAAYPGVRQALTLQQRRIGLRGQVVMVGRDIGTVVLPEADLKIYLDASVEERARRRYDECVSRGDDVDYQDVLESMRRRDQLDTSRALAPLRPADDAVIVNSDGLTIEQVIERVKQLL